VTVIEVVEEVDIVDRQVGEVVFRDTRLLVANVSSGVNRVARGSIRIAAE
jgi:hypothetical protein